jgi:hypothetical protein
MFKDVHTTKFRLFPDGHLHVYDHKLAGKVNRVLKRYKDSPSTLYQFKKGEGAIFRLAQIKLNEHRSRVLKILGVQSVYPLP